MRGDGVWARVSAGGVVQRRKQPIHNMCEAGAEWLVGEKGVAFSWTARMRWVLGCSGSREVMGVRERGGDLGGLVGVEGDGGWMR